MKAAEQIQVLKYRFNCHKQDTAGFTLDIESLTDDEAFEMAPVMQDTINGLSSLVLKIVHPKQAPELKTQIAYLIALRDRQERAWDAKRTEYKTRLNNTKQWVQNHA
jgi:hypothetical protein